MATDKDQLEPIAIAGFDRSGSGGKVDILDEYQPELRGRKGRRTIRQMTNDETIGSVRLGIDAFFRSVSFFADAPEDEDIDGDVAEGYRQWAEDTLFRDLGDPKNNANMLTWEDFLINSMTSLDFGWAYFDVPLYKKADGTLGIADLMLVAQETLDGWNMDETGRYVTGLYQRSPSGVSGPWDRFVGIERAVHFIASPFKSSPEGRSSYRHIYTPWYYKRKLMAIEAILAERGCGFPVLYVDATVKKAADDGHQWAKDVVAYSQELVENVKRNSQSGAVIYSSPYKTFSDGGAQGWTSMRTMELKLETPGQSNSGDIDRAIKRYDAAIARGLLATFLMLGTDGKGGSLSLGNDLSNLFLKAITGWLEMFTTVVNRQLMPMLWKANGFPEEYMPHIRAGDLTQKTIDQVSAYVRDLAAAGIMLTDPETEDYLREQGGLPKRPNDGAADLPPIPTEDDDPRGRAQQVTKEKNENGYASVKLDKGSASYIRDKAEKAGIEGLIPDNELHLTLMYSRDSGINTYPDPTKVYTGRIVGEPKIIGKAPWRALVVEIESDELRNRHEELKRAGGVHSYDDFLPHLSLKYDPSEDDLDKLKGNMPEGMLVFSGESFKPINN